VTTPTKQPTDKLPRVSRGGGWYNTVPSVFHSAYRIKNTHAHRYINLGFRCVQTGCRQVLTVNP
jgi:formylglycine-generating enzyme required for sulfatase activity